MNEIGASAFTEHGDGDERGVSMEWNKYSTREQTRARAKSPQDNLVVALRAGDIRAISGLTLEHRPLPGNRAHCNVKGVVSIALQRQLREVCWIVLDLDS